MAIWIRNNEVTTTKQEQLFQKTDTGSSELEQLWERTDTGAIRISKKEGSLLSGNVNLVQTNEYTITATPIDPTQQWWFFFHVDNSLREDSGYVQVYCSVRETWKSLALNVSLPTTTPTKAWFYWARDDSNAKACMHNQSTTLYSYLNGSSVKSKSSTQTYQMKIKTTPFGSSKYTDFLYNVGDTTLSEDNAYVDLGGYGLFAAPNGDFTATVSGYNATNQTWKITLIE